MEGYFRFTDHWASFVESYAQATAKESGFLSLPEITSARDRSDGIVVHIPAAYERMALFYGGQPVNEQPEAGTSLSVGELLAMLPWQLAPPEVSAAWQGGLPERVLIRLCAKRSTDFAHRVGELRDAVFALNGRGVRDVTFSAAFPSDAPDGYPHEALFFVARLSSRSLALWLQKQVPHADTESQISVYQPYELAVPPEHSQQPYGAWLPLQLAGQTEHQITKPFMTVLAHEARRGNQVWLLESTSNGTSSAVRRMVAPFLPLYYFSRFELASPPHVVSPGMSNRARGDVRRPFLIGLELRQDGERLGEHKQMRESLQTSRSWIAQRQAELEREDRRLRHLLRLVDAEAIQAVGPDQAGGMDVFGRQPRKRLYLFSERHSDQPKASTSWVAFQELLLNASLAELRNLRYAYCSFDFASPDGSIHSTTFHLIGCGTSAGFESRPDNPPPHLERAESEFEQDADWRRIGYNLYLPKGRMLYPPLRPWSPGQRTDRDNGDHGSDGQADSWPGPSDKRQMFDDLLAQAVFVPEGTQAAEAIRARVDEFWEAGANRDNLCLIYEDPHTGCLIPIFLRATDFVPLSEAAIGHLNQSGLLAGPTVMADPKGPIVGVARQTDLLLVEAFRQQIETGNLSQSAEQMARALKKSMLQILYKSLGRRKDELDRHHQRLIEEYETKTDALAAELETVQRDWQQTKQSLNDALRDLRTKTRATERLTAQLRKDRDSVEELAQQGIHKWEEFVARILEITLGLQGQADEVSSEASAQVRKATADLQIAQSEIVSDVVGRLRTMQDGLVEIGAQTGEKTVALQRVINYLAEAQAALGQPAQAPMPREQADAVGVASVMKDLEAARIEAALLRTQLEQQQAESETRIQEMQGDLNDKQRQMTRSTQDLEQRAAGAEARERQLRSETGQSAAHIQRLNDQLTTLRQQIQTTNSEHNSAMDDLTRRLTEITDELRRTQTDLETAQGQLHEGDRLGRDLNFEPTRRRFLALAEVVDGLRRAESPDPSMRAYNEGLRRVRQGFHAYFREQFQVSAIEIEPGSTPFDYHAGHKAIGVTWVSTLPEGVILNAVSDGYLFQGRCLREAQVSVNQKPLEASI